MEFLFEVHITTPDLREKEISSFESFCKNIQAKPILIELSQGDTYRQPMISKVFRCELPEEIHQEIDQLVNQFKIASYPVKRVKIEVPLEIEKEGAATFPESDKKYFEWHGKVFLEREEILKTLCQKHDAHLSKNALKRDNKSRFITIRDYKQADSIRQRVAALKGDLHKQGWALSKEEFEYCVYDSNEALDKGWIN